MFTHPFMLKTANCGHKSNTHTFMRLRGDQLCVCACVISLHVAACSCEFSRSRALSLREARRDSARLILTSWKEAHMTLAAWATRPILPRSPGYCWEKREFIPCRGGGCRKAVLEIQFRIWDTKWYGTCETTYDTLLSIQAESSFQLLLYIYIYIYMGPQREEDTIPSMQSN